MAPNTSAADSTYADVGRLSGASRADEQTRLLMQQQHAHQLAVAHSVYGVDDNLVELGVFRDLGRRLQRLRPLLPSVEGE